MIAFANAKINLGLFITDKRPDGYHNLESIFLPVSLNDVVEVVRSEKPGIRFSTHGIEFAGEVSDNLCVKAYHLLDNEFRLGGVDAFLLKNVPVGAGLGGGSSDASFMLKLLNEMFGLNLANGELKDFAARLGSDCPFFIDNRPAFVTGRGEVLEPVDIDLKGVHVVIVHPGIHIGTREAYQHIKPAPAGYDLRKISKLRRKQWAAEISNDFEPHMLSTFPQIGEIKEKLYAMGAFYACMSGSGSSVYGLFESAPEIAGQFEGWFCRTAEVIS